MSLKTYFFIVSLFLIGYMTSSAMGTKKPPKTVNIFHHNEPHWVYTAQGKWDPIYKVPRTLYNVQYGPLTGSPEENARQYLNRNKNLFKINSVDAELQTTQVQQSPAGYHVRFNQVVNDIPVFGSDIVVSMNQKNIITFVVNNSRPGLSLPSLVPATDTAAVVQSVKNYLNVKGKIFGVEGPDLFVLAEQQTHLSYRTVISTNDPDGAWELFTDAVSGQVLSARDINIYDYPHSPGALATTANGHGNIYDPDPLTTSHKFYGSTGYTDNNHSDSPQLTAQEHYALLRDISFNGSVYTLSGPYVQITDWDIPNIPIPTKTNADSFAFTRSNPGFEDVNVYYHLDNSQRYLQGLGFFSIQNGPITADPQGKNGDDNSSFNPSLNALSYGQGGVPDAEDADVILHEYGHAIQNGTVHGWGGGEEGAIGEGFGDYWAASYSRAADPSFSKYFIFTWDAGFNGTTVGTVWPGRILNDTRTYPDTGVAGGEVHDEGQIWSSVLMSLYDDLGRATMDPLVLQSHFYMGTSGTMPDNAAAVVQADRDQTGGSHLNVIIPRFLSRNFLAQPSATITPLGDTESMNGPFTVSMTITAGYFPIDLQHSYLVWGRDSLFTDTSALVQTGVADGFMAQIAGNGSAAHYRYYLVVRDSFGTTVTLPSNAPTGFYSFYAGPDVISPVVTATPVHDQAVIHLPFSYSIKASDNIAIKSVLIEYYRQRGNVQGSFSLSASSNSVYTGSFPFTSSDVEIGDSIFYKIVVSDNAHTPNIVTLPSSGYWKYYVSRGNILIVDNDVSSGALIPSTTLFYTTIRPFGFSIDTTNLIYLSTITLPQYDVVIWCTGVNAGPMASYDKRLAFVDWVKGGGTTWIEGGNIGWLYRKNGPFDTQTDLRAFILHDSLWIDDAPGSNIIFSAPVNTIFTQPHSLNQPIVLNTVAGSADRDANILNPADAKAMQLAGWSGEPTTASIIASKRSGTSLFQTLYFSFAVSAIADSTVAKNLIENSIQEFFVDPITSVAPEPPSIPKAFRLEQNYPNPFNPVTIIHYDVPERSHVSLKVFNLLGQEIKTVANEDRDAGSYSVRFDGKNLSSGIYFYQISAGKFLDSKKMVLIK